MTSYVHVCMDDSDKTSKGWSSIAALQLSDHCNLFANYMYMESNMFKVEIALFLQDDCDGAIRVVDSAPLKILFYSASVHAQFVQYYDILKYMHWKDLLPEHRGPSDFEFDSY